MKKILMAIALMVAGVNGATAQSNYEYDIWDVIVGGKVGASATTLTKLNADFQFFPTAAAYAEMYLNKKMSMSLEVSYAHRGGKSIYAKNVPENGPYTYNMHYINTSYLFKYFPVKRLGVYSGLTLGRMFAAKAKKDHTNDIMDELHKGDFSVPVGLEYTIGEHFTVDARWNWSPRWIAKTNKAKLILGKTRNQAFMLTVGYKLQVF